MTSSDKPRTIAASFKDLLVWRKAYDLTLQVYRLTEAFPSRERYVLSSQLRRAALSVPANIAEGFTRFSQTDKLRFLNIARGSLEECRCYLMLVRDLKFGDTTASSSTLEDVSILLARFEHSIRKNPTGGRK